MRPHLLELIGQLGEKWDNTMQNKFVSENKTLYYKNFLLANNSFMPQI